MDGQIQALLAELAQEIGTLKVNEIALTLQLGSAQQQLAAVSLDREGLKSRSAELELERNRLAARVQELEGVPPATGPTPKRSHTRKVPK